MTTLLKLKLLPNLSDRTIFGWKFIHVMSFNYDNEQGVIAKVSDDGKKWDCVELGGEEFFNEVFCESYYQLDGKHESILKFKKTARALDTETKSLEILQFNYDGRGVALIQLLDSDNLWQLSILDDNDFSEVLTNYDLCD